MKMFFTSDLHLYADARGDKSIQALAAYVCENGAPDDVLIIAGDCGEEDVVFASCLRLFSRFQGTRLAVAGNHDVWTRPGSMDSFEKHQYIQELMFHNGFWALEVAPNVINGIGFAGCMGWYDYTFRDPIGIAKEWYDAKTYPGDNDPGWNDAVFARWNGISDAQITEQQVWRLKDQLSSLSERTDRIVVVTHHTPMKKLLFNPRFLLTRRQRFFNAFLGSEQFEKLFTQYADRIALSVSGHIHLGRDVRGDGGVRYVSVGGNYQTKQLLIVSEGGQINRKNF